jgi:hypothetical protein
MTEDGFSEAGRKQKFEQWEKLGLDRVKGDLQADPYRRIGSGPLQNLAWEWVRMKEAEKTANAEAVLRAIGAAPPSISDILAGETTELDRMVKRAQSVVATPEQEQPPLPASPSEKPVEMVTLKPTLYGMSIDLKEAGRRLKRRFRKKP